MDGYYWFPSTPVCQGGMQILMFGLFCKYANWTLELQTETKQSGQYVQNLDRNDFEITQPTTISEQFHLYSQHRVNSWYDFSISILYIIGCDVKGID